MKNFKLDIDVLRDKINMQKRNLLSFKAVVEEHNNFFKQKYKFEALSNLIQNQSLFDEKLIPVVKEPIYSDKRWCGEPIKRNHFFRGLDNADSLVTQKSFNFERFMLKY